MFSLTHFNHIMTVWFEYDDTTVWNVTSTIQTKNLNNKDQHNIWQQLEI